MQVVYQGENSLQIGGLASVTIITGGLELLRPFYRWLLNREAEVDGAGCAWLTFTGPTAIGSPLLR